MRWPYRRPMDLLGGAPQSARQSLHVSDRALRESIALALSYSRALGNALHSAVPLQLLHDCAPQRRYRGLLVASQHDLLVARIHHEPNHHLDPMVVHRASVPPLRL